MGIFHFLFNYIIFTYNYILGNNKWIMNNNSIGEAQIEIIIMTIMIPFVIYGFILYLKKIGDTT